MSANNIFKILNYRAVVRAINSGHFTARPFHVGFVVDGVLLGQGFSEYLGVLSVSFRRCSIPIFQTAVHLAIAGAIESWHLPASRN